MRKVLRVCLLASCGMIAASCGGASSGKGAAAGSGGKSAGAGGGTAGTGGTSGIAGADGGGVGGSGGIEGSAPPIEPLDDAGDSVLRHHKNLNRDGVYIEPAITKAAVTSGDAGVSGLVRDPAFSAVLPDANDHVFAQPLFVDGQGGQDMVIVATEANNVYALDATTGAILWTRNVGVPVPASAKPCGNLDPFGVTGTPVIDFPSRTLFFDAEILPASTNDAGVAGMDSPRHEIFALSIDTGAVKAGWPVDVAAVAKSGSITFNSPFYGQRGALAIRAGSVYVPYGGLFGDCQPGPHFFPSGDQTPYHGWVVSVSISDPSAVKAWATPACGGGLWAPGGVSSDRTSLFVATGNTDPACTGKGTVWGGGEAVLRFGAGEIFGEPADYFAPEDWATRDNEDLEMGSAPVEFDLPGSTPGQLAMTFGKDGNAYLLDRTHLGGVGSALDADGGAANAFSSQVASLRAAVTPIITAPAVYTTASGTYVAFFGNGAFCQQKGGGTLAALRINPGTPPTLSGAWCADGGNGSPIVTTSDGQSDAIVWQMGAENDNRLHAFDGDSGAPLTFPGGSVTIPGMRRYNSPIAAKGRIFVAADGAVVAFKP